MDNPNPQVSTPPEPKSTGSQTNTQHTTVFHKLIQQIRTLEEQKQFNKLKELSNVLDRNITPTHSQPQQ